MIKPWITFLPALSSHDPALEKIFLMLLGRLLTKLTARLTPAEIVDVIAFHAQDAPCLIRFHPAEMTLPRRFYAARAIATIAAPKLEKADFMKFQTPEPICLIPSHA